MPHDIFGNELKLGDFVSVHCEVTAIQKGEDFCNITARTVEPMPGVGHEHYALSEGALFVGHWVCECGADLGDAPIDEIDEVFTNHKRSAGTTITLNSRQVAMIPGRPVNGFNGPPNSGVCQEQPQAAGWEPNSDYDWTKQGQ